jgi:outer membrane receptor protein involved in Fe transport
MKNNAVSMASVVALLVAAAAMPMIATAQDSEPAADELANIVVTGTRIVRDGFQAPTPLTVVGAEELQSSATQNVADFVNTLPVFSGSISPASTQATVSNGQSNLNALNLRSLGANRTLVLLDGQRSVGINSTGLVDINLMPQGLIKRVDVVTGGASAAYGSDALAGVVNFVLDKTFTGFKTEVGGGITDYGDNGSWDVNMTAGLPFADGRGHFLINGGANHVAGIPRITRDWNKTGYQRMTNPAYGTGPGQSTSVPQLLMLTRVSPTNGFSGGGVITSGPLRGTAFGEGGTIWQYQQGSITFDPDTYDSPNFEATQCRGHKCDGSLASRSSTQNVFTRLSFDVTDNLNVYGQAAWAHDWNQNDCCSMESNASLTIRSGNPFIPAPIQARMDELGLTTLLMGSQHEDLPNVLATNDRNISRFVLGAAGGLNMFESKWTWDAYYQRGYARQMAEAKNAVKRTALTNALDAVRGPNGAVICRVTQTNPAEGCVPYNIFGVNVNTEAAVNYVEGSGELDFRNEKFTQDVWAASIQGSPFSTWAGPVSLATGIEHRKESVTGYNDDQSDLSNWWFGNYKVFDADYSVTEAFVETVVPLAADKAWAKSLDLNAAVRGTDYSTSGYVTTWKVGATWAPIDDIRFRATRSRDIRAPNLNELFNAGGGSAPAVRNPFRGNQSETILGNSVGNPDLLPEKADATGVGVVLQPRFVPGFSASIDYWNLDIDGAIGSLSVQQIIDQCYTGNQSYCDAVSFYPDGSQRVEFINNQPFNLVTQVARGWDFEASYFLPVANVVDSWAGNLSFRFLGTHYVENYSSNGINLPTDTAGQNTGNGPPSWRWTASTTYDLEPVRLTFTARGVSSGTYDNSYIVCTTGCPVSRPDATTITSNSISGQVVYDASFTYRFDKFETYLNIRNLLNSDPVQVAAGAGGFSYASNLANAALYDVYGRMYRAGFRLKL